MSWLGKLFGTDKAVGSVLETGKELLDDAFYTDDEKASDRKESAKDVRAMIVEWMKNTQGQNLSGRVIALGTTLTWLLQFWLAWVFSVVAIFCEADVAAKLTEAAELTRTSAADMSGAVLLVLGFYFAAPKISEIADSAIASFGKRNLPK